MWLIEAAPVTGMHTQVAIPPKAREKQKVNRQDVVTRLSSKAQIPWQPCCSVLVPSVTLKEGYKNILAGVERTHY